MNLVNMQAQYNRLCRVAQEATGPNRIAAQAELMSFATLRFGEVIQHAQRLDIDCAKLRGNLSQALTNNQDLLVQIQTRDAGLGDPTRPPVADAAGDMESDPNTPGHGAD